MLWQGVGNGIESNEKVHGFWLKKTKHRQDQSDEPDKKIRTVFFKQSKTMMWSTQKMWISLRKVGPDHIWYFQRSESKVTEIRTCETSNLSLKHVESEGFSKLGCNWKSINSNGKLKTSSTDQCPGWIMKFQRLESWFSFIDSGNLGNLSESWKMKLFLKNKLELTLSVD